MSYSLQVSDVVWEGHRFTAGSEDGPITGIGSCQMNEDMTGGVITGSISSGPQTFLERLVKVFFEGNHGTCVATE